MRSVPRAGAPAATVVRFGGWSARVVPWQSDDHLAQVQPFGGLPSPSPEVLEAALADIAALGYDRVVTTALAPGERDAFVAAGFDEVERLHLLVRALDDVPPPRAATSLRRPRRGEWPAMVDVDRRAFLPFWHLDTPGITEALHATPAARLRVAVDGGVAGYAVTGRSGRRGYVQRLAVDPAHTGRGLGSDLLLDGLRWLRARGATTALVNTQVANDRALSLYERHGFAPASHDLVVLGRAVGTA